MNVVINFLLFQVAWFACVLGAAYDYAWLGPLVVALVLLHHLARAPQPRAELALAGLAAGVGLLFDSVLVATGWLVYPSGQWHAMLAPYWIVAMWVAFATTLNVSLGWLKDRHVLAVAFGAIGGPLAYLAGEKLGAVTIVETGSALFALAVGWAVITPLLLRAASALLRAQRDPGRDGLAAATE